MEKKSFVSENMECYDALPIPNARNAIIDGMGLSPWIDTAGVDPSSSIDASTWDVEDDPDAICCEIIIKVNRKLYCDHLREMCETLERVEKSSPGVYDTSRIDEYKQEIELFEQTPPVYKP